MNVKKLFIAVLLLAFSSVSYAQDSTFNITFPEGWTQFQQAEVFNSIRYRYELTDKMKQDILANNSSKQLFGYSAPVKPGALYRPNIQVILLKRHTKTFTQFKADVQRSLDGFKNIIHDMEILDPVSAITIDGKISLYAKSTGYFPLKTGGRAKFISRLYAIPSGNYFYQITMNDSPNYDCEEEFKKVLSSLKL